LLRSSASISAIETPCLQQCVQFPISQSNDGELRRALPDAARMYRHTQAMTVRYSAVCAGLSLDRSGDRRAVRGIVALQPIEPVGAAGSAVIERQGGDAGPVKKAVEPFLRGQIELDALGIGEDRYLPRRHRTEIDRAAAPRAALDQAAGRG
jgi:hypothetical protein